MKHFDFLGVIQLLECGSTDVMEVIGSYKIVVDVVFAVLVLDEKDLFLKLGFLFGFGSSRHERLGEHEALSLLVSMLTICLVLSHAKAFFSIDAVEELLEFEIFSLSNADITFILSQNDIKQLDCEVNFIGDFFVCLGPEFPQIWEWIVDVEVTN